MTRTLTRRSLLAAPLALTSRAQRPRHPNILFLFADDLRAGTTGTPAVHTPNLNALARAGTSFRNCYGMGGTSAAVCAPSRAMLMTGRTLFHIPPAFAVPFAHRGPDSGRSEHPTMPAVFGDAGYRTFATGKWHNGTASFAAGFRSGASIFFGGMSDHNRIPLADYDPSGRYPQEARRTSDGFSSEIFAGAAIRFLREHRSGEPFFAYTAFTAPHDPRTPPRQYAAMYAPERVQLPPNFLPRHPFDNGELNVRDENLAPKPRTKADVRKHLADYYGMISHLDEQIGRILAALRETGKDRDTIIVFASDNGLAVGQHGLLGKQNLYEHSIRVPLIVAGPGVAQGRVSDRFVYLLDLFPTLCGLAGIRAPGTVEGQNVFGKRADRFSMFFAYRHIQRAVREGDWKLIAYNVDGRKRRQLFDLHADPWERNDLAADARHAARVTGLHSRLRTWMSDLDDPNASLFAT